MMFFGQYNYLVFCTYALIHKKIFVFLKRSNSFNGMHVNLDSLSKPTYTDL